MVTKTQEAFSQGLRISLENEKGIEVAHAYIYIAKNDLHQLPFAFIEDVMVDESCRGQGLGKKIMQKLIELARQYCCYKIVACSRHNRTQVHKFYSDLGFTNRGLEFRLDL